MVLRLISLILAVVVGLFYYNNFIADNPEVKTPGKISTIAADNSISVTHLPPVTHLPVEVDEEFEKIKAKTLKEFEEFQLRNH